MTPLWQSRFVVPSDAVDLFLNATDEEVLSIAAFEIDGAENGDGQWWRVEMLHREEPDPEDLSVLLEPIAARAKIQDFDIEIERLPDSDWVEHVQREFEPFEIGRFWIHGSHVDVKPPKGQVPIQLDAGMAFGSGEHPTTEGCLRALDQLARRRRFGHVLDMGCGAGVLAIAAAKCWPSKVLAVDNDEVAVAVARDNARINGVDGRCKALVSEGYAHPMIRASGPYDLVLSNILADPLCEMARDLASHLAYDGVAILAGLLGQQARQVIASHQVYGMFLRDKIKIGPWTILVMSRKKT
ncbi:MAG: 50S ribosomal protein L11 methyltransferase [Geminicoccaceae bacterium]